MFKNFNLCIFLTETNNTFTLITELEEDILKKKYINLELKIFIHKIQKFEAIDIQRQLYKKKKKNLSNLDNIKLNLINALKIYSHINNIKYY